MRHLFTRVNPFDDDDNIVSRHPVVSALVFLAGGMALSQTHTGRAMIAHTRNALGLEEPHLNALLPPGQTPTPAQQDQINAVQAQAQQQVGHIMQQQSPVQPPPAQETPTHAAGRVLAAVTGAPSALADVFRPSGAAMRPAPTRPGGIPAGTRVKYTGIAYNGGIAVGATGTVQAASPDSDTRFVPVFWDERRLVSHVLPGSLTTIS